MLDIVELATKIVMEHGAKHNSPEQIVNQIKSVYSELKMMKENGVIPTPENTKNIKLSVEEAFGKDEVKCLICGCGGMKVLKQHLTKQHHITPVDYRQQFGLPEKLPLVCNAYHEQRRNVAIASGLGRTHHKRRASATPIVKSAKKK